MHAGVYVTESFRAILATYPSTPHPAGSLPRVGQAGLRTVRPSNLHITPAVRRDIVLRRKRDGFLVAFAPGHHGPNHPRNLV